MTVAESPSKRQVRSEATAYAGETCPKCHSTESWGESSWCPKCNYYPTVDNGVADGRSWADDLPDLPEEEQLDNRSALQSIPVWFWVMLGGVSVITIFSVTIRTVYPREDSPRGLIALAQLVLGAITMLIAHLCAARFALKNDRRLNFNDVILCWFNIWQPTIARLPATCKRVQAMVCGMVAVFTAVMIIGGIDYSAPFRTDASPKKISPAKLIGAVTAAANAQAGKKNPVSMQEALSEVANMEEAAGLANGPMTMEQALNELGNLPDKLSGMEDLTDDQIDTTFETFNCYVYGVETNEYNAPTALLFAMKVGRRNRHVARLETSEIPRTDLRTIIRKIGASVLKKPAAETSFDAVWVAPVVSVRLAFDGLTEDGDLDNVKFEAILVRQRGVFDSEQ
ncbi:hypothetical protein [Fuerstiella marisgermanici]|uniref:Uncharacterized protein n=1 Tax=Fuerstiella marisgermanici TaxID=1891926 RepID=A0A1P8WG88_9PLAN|nr:hypothetical protein [Fuerstiella marisgermanici]APZ93057.1 hypothetical protein Fuma_02672 [Fuerstiella marisgermanici]